MQINLRLSTPPKSPMRFTLELVGIFEYAGDKPDEGKAQVMDFVREKGLHMLWPYTDQMIRLLSGQMGMKPLETKTPVAFDIAMGQNTQPPAKKSAATKKTQSRKTAKRIPSKLGAKS